MKTRVHFQRIDGLQCDPFGGLKPSVDFDLGCSAIMLRHQVATVAARQLPELYVTKSTRAFNRPDGSPCKGGGLNPSLPP